MVFGYFEVSRLRFCVAVLALRLAIFAAAVVFGASPARAQALQEDTNPLNSMLGFFGMQFDKDKDASITAPGRRLWFRRSSTFRRRSRSRMPPTGRRIPTSRRPATPRPPRRPGPADHPEHARRNVG